MFVAGSIGDTDNKIAYSYDGITWVNTSVSSIFDQSSDMGVRSIAWNGQLWVAGGDNNLDETVIATSPDGINWTKRTIPVSLTIGPLHSVAWNGSLWMAVGEDGITGRGFILTSPNGTTWTNISSNLGGTNPFLRIKTVSWNGARWFIGGNSPTSTGVLLTSADAITWTSKATGIGTRIYATASRRVLPYVGEPLIGPTTPTLSLSYYLSANTGANTGPNAISVIGFNTPDPSNTVTGGTLDMNYNTGDGVLTNTSSKTISVLVSGQVTTDNTAFDLDRIQPCLYVTKNSDNIVSSSVINFNGSAFSTIVVLIPNETITIRYSQTSPYDPVSDVSGVYFIGGQFSTRITFTQMEFEHGPSYGGGADYFSGVVRSSLIPDTPKTYDLGSTGFPFRSLYVTGTTIYVGGAALKEEGGSIQLVSSDGNASAGPTGPSGASVLNAIITYAMGTPDVNDGSIGDTYVETDAAVIYHKENIDVSGAWQEVTSATQRKWTSIASSANGQYVAAVVANNKVYTNNNYGGGSWTEVTIDLGVGDPYNLCSITSDSTGQYLAMVDNQSVGSFIYTSNNYGVLGSWTYHNPISAPWTSITSSSNGTRLTAVSSNGIIATSTNRGTTWTVTRANFGSTFADFVFTFNGYSTVVATNGYIYNAPSLLTLSTWTRIGPDSNPPPTYRTAKVYDIGATDPLIISTLDGMNTIKYTTDNNSFTSIGDSHIWTSVAATDAVNTDFFAVYSDGAGGIIQNTDLSGVVEITNPPDSVGVFVSIAAVKESGTDTYSFVVADQGQYIHTCEYVANTDTSTWIKGNKTATWTSVALVPDYRSTQSYIILATARDISGGIYICDAQGLGPPPGAVFTKITTSSTSNQFTSVTVCGLNGTYAAAAVGLNDYVYVSTDGYFSTWTAKTGFGKRDFSSISSIAADPLDPATMELLAADTSGNVWYSGDQGTSWSIKTPTPSFSCVTSDICGNFLAATDSGLNLTDPAGDVWSSENSGVSWSVKDNLLNPPHRPWRYITFQPLTNYLYAIEGVDIYTSDINVVTYMWSPIMPVSPDTENWTSINCSTSTQKIVLTESGGSIWVYDGSTWTSQTTPGTNTWKCSAISSDASRIIVGASDSSATGPIWRLLPDEVVARWEEKMDMGAAATYTTSSSSYWADPPGAPTKITEAVNRIAFALYTATSDTPIP
jgi:hypothetical protein